jgi:uncharacterized MAPEG superfamily protein
MLPSALKSRYISALLKSKGEAWDHAAFNAAPRTATQALIDEGSEFSDAISRCAAAHQNGWEALLLFGLGVMAARFGGVPDTGRAVASIVYSAARLVYNLVYCAPVAYGGGSPKAGTLRSTCWSVGTAASLYLMTHGWVRAAAL